MRNLWLLFYRTWLICFEYFDWWLGCHFFSYFNSISQAEVATRTVRLAHFLDAVPNLLSRPHHQTNRVKNMLAQSLAHLIGNLEIFNANSTSLLCFFFICDCDEWTFESQTCYMLKSILSLFCFVVQFVILTSLIQSSDDSILCHLDQH